MDENWLRNTALMSSSPLDNASSLSLFPSVHVLWPSDWHHRSVVGIEHNRANRAILIGTTSLRQRSA
jgi:hypothetical protein